MVERWVLSGTPGQPKEENNHHGPIRDMIVDVASSHVLSLISVFTAMQNRAFLSVAFKEFSRQARCNHFAMAFQSNKIFKIRVTALQL